MKYLGTLTPYKGLWVYTHAAMGMPRSTEHLDELMSRVLGDHEGSVVKLADDLSTGGNTIPDLLYNWQRILQRFEANNLRTSVSYKYRDLSNVTHHPWLDLVSRHH